jgi:hypothetical protein
VKQSAWLFAAAHIDTLRASIAVTYGTFETQDFRGHSGNLAATVKAARARLPASPAISAIGPLMPREDMAAFFAIVPLAEVADLTRSLACAVKLRGASLEGHQLLECLIRST